MTQLQPQTQPSAPPPTPPRGTSTGMKWLAGCLITLLVISLVIAGLVWWAFNHYVKPLADGFLGLAQLEQLDKNIKNTGPYTPPSDGKLEGAQLERFLKVQSAMKNAVGNQLQALESKAKALEQGSTDQNNVDIPKFLEGLGGLFKTIVSAKEAQVQSLNDLNMKKLEYEWIRDETYRAVLGQATNQTIKNFEGFPNLSGKSTPLPAIGDESLKANIALISPHQDNLLKNYALHTFGF